MDLRVFEEELDASKRRKGGANPAIYEVAITVAVTVAVAAAVEGGIEDVVGGTGTALAAAETEATEVDGAEKSVSPGKARPGTEGDETEVVFTATATEYKFTANEHPLRFVPTGRSGFLPILFGTPEDTEVREDSLIPSCI